MSTRTVATDYESLRKGMLDLARERLPEWTDHSPSDIGVVLVELMAWMGDQILYHQERVANESYLATAVEDSSVRKLLALVGITPNPQRAASGYLELHFGVDAGELDTVLPTGALFRASFNGESVPFRYLDAPILVTGGRSKIVRIPVRQVDEVVVSEVLGSSSGLGDQRFSLRRERVLSDSLELRVDEEVWSCVPSLMLSGPEDLHFVLETSADGVCVVSFGDGVCGRVPALGSRNVVASFLVGGGARGNLGGGRARWIFEDPPQLRSVSNPAPMSGGADPERLSNAARRAPLQFRAMERAVTASDFEVCAVALGAMKAKARAGTWNRVAVYVLPPGAVPGSTPSADDPFMSQLQAQLQARAMITVAVDLYPIRWAPVRLALVVELAGRADPSLTRQRVRDAVAALFTPERLELGARFHLSKVYEAVEALSGVGAVYVSRFGRPGSTELPPGGFLTTEAYELPALDESNPDWITFRDPNND